MRPAVTLLLGAIEGSVVARSALPEFDRVYRSVHRRRMRWARIESVLSVIACDRHACAVFDDAGGGAVRLVRLGRCVPPDARCASAIGPHPARRARAPRARKRLSLRLSMTAAVAVAAATLSAPPHERIGQIIYAITFTDENESACERLVEREAVANPAMCALTTPRLAPDSRFLYRAGLRWPAMHDPDHLWGALRRSDLVMVVGLALITYTAIEGAWGAIGYGMVLLIVGFLIPRMKGPFSLGAPNLQFKGELVDPTVQFRGVIDPGGTPSEHQRDAQTAGQEQPLPQAPPPSSLPPGE